MSIQYFSTIAIVTFLFGACGPQINTDYTIYNPTKIQFRGQTAAALDNKGNIWQWNYDGKWVAAEPIKVGIKNVVGFDLNFGESIGYAVTESGEIHRWLFYAPQSPEILKTEKPVRKMTAKGAFLLFLHDDGTMTSNGKNSLVGMGAPNAHNDRMELDKLTNIVDYYWGGDYLVAIDDKGECYAVSGTGLQTVVPNVRTSDGKPVKIKGLSNVKRFTSASKGYFAFTNDNEIYFWKNGSKKKEIQKLDFRGNHFTDDRLLTQDGTMTPLNLRTSSAELPKLKSEDQLFEPKRGYGVWYLHYYSKYLIALDEEGRLWQYEYNPQGKNGKETGERKRIGDFKVRLDYFKS